MSVTSSQQTSNIQILQFDGITLPPQSTLKVDYVNGVKEGVGILMSSMRIIIGKLNFHDDKLEGLNIFFNSTGEKSKEGLFVNGIHNGWGREYKDDKVVFEGIYRNGERYSELKKSATDGYMDEVKDGKTLSTFKYNNNHIVEGKGWLFEYDGNKVTAVFECENGEKRIKRIQFDNNEMIELNDNGKVVYRGGFTGNPRDGFVRNGEGNEFDDNDSVMYCGGWHNGYREGNGRLYDNGSLKYKGEWKEGRPYGKGKLYNSDGDVVMEKVWKNDNDDLKNGILELMEGKTNDYKSGEVIRNEVKKSEPFSQPSQSKLITSIRYPSVKINIPVMKPEPVSQPSRPKPIRTVKMVIENEGQLRELLKNVVNKRVVKELVIAEGCGNGMKNDFELCGFENLESIAVKNNTLRNLNSLKISYNPILKSIETEDGEWNDGNPTGALRNVKSVSITSTLIDD